MHWPTAITRNRDALLAIVASIIALLGRREAGPVARRLRNAALALLRPAESAARRLIVIAARGLTVTPRPRPQVSAGFPAQRTAPVAAHPPAFRLFDRRKRFVPPRFVAPPRGIPRIRSFFAAPSPLVATAQPPVVAETAAAPGRPGPDAPADIAHLILRLAALERALANLPHQARRLARWRARRQAGRQAGPGAPFARGPRSPLRPGRPPGWRLRPVREVDAVLKECHALALDALADTS